MTGIFLAIMGTVAAGLGAAAAGFEKDGVVDAVLGPF